MNCSPGNIHNPTQDQRANLIQTNWKTGPNSGINPLHHSVHRTSGNISTVRVPVTMKGKFNWN